MTTKKETLNALRRLHRKILKSKLTESVTEEEITALVAAEEIVKQQAQEETETACDVTITYRETRSVTETLRVTQDELDMLREANLPDRIAVHLKRCIRKKSNTDCDWQAMDDAGHIITDFG